MAVTFILDTSAYSNFKKGDSSLRPWFDAENTIIVPIIVVGELKAGFAAGNRQAENNAQLQMFLNSANVLAAGVTEMQTTVYGRLYAELRKSGKPIGTNDMWIAALALERDIELLTLDSDFARVPGLKLASV